ncbi:MAG: hypothetical protein JSW05_09515 [Candidatus Thorarchaeota archaeon]|nr:MAG: hypothetical protein JSW05_09515 [Candidatus Thorarchaeota archaeon]
MSAPEFDRDPFRNIRILALVFLAYAIVLPLLALMLPESTLPASTGSSLLSWVMILLMPFEIVLVYVFYRYFARNPRFENLLGPAVLMYVLATTPSIYALTIGMIDSSLRLIAIPLGLMFSIVGLWLALMLLSKIPGVQQAKS